jgi:hypothetical protein
MSGRSGINPPHPQVGQWPEMKVIDILSVLDPKSIHFRQSRAMA